jgi:hypothetical protein
MMNISFSWLLNDIFFVVRMLRETKGTLPDASGRQQANQKSVYVKENNQT